ncbi:Inositol-tetrakisphosphate 1-kinase [Portunus trituberculatus]|uniref:Inositol-tetrakisphosphate 1-kinase n=1 Tax=Portunus trituberculatus TaxID=210409 RepID=A0A5B7DV61_PORTR|nr:Inositol-tetrakisphosphate 1-kinase [Portunus trituberculatus]
MIDMNSPLDDQGPFDLILHKVTVLYAQALNNNDKAANAINMFENYIKKHPETFVMDPLPGVHKLLLRNQTYELLHQRFRYDVCKPVTGGGGVEAHEMAVVFNEMGLSEFRLPCVAQSFINHGAVLYKLFVLGPVWFVIVRPSLKNFYAGEQETVYFNSSNVSKADSRSPLTQLDPGDMEDELPKADPAVFNRIVTNLREALNMDLLGIDVVIDSNTGKYGIIDVNAFPSYDSVPNLMEHLVDLLVMRMDHPAPESIKQTPEDKKIPTFTTCDHPQEDSGVDTG